MTERTTVHVMRHGEVHNPEKVLYGRLPDYHLSERGRAQAQAAADWLAHNDIVYVVASPLERAQETAGAHRRGARPGDRHRRRPHRVVERLRGRARSRPATARCATRGTGCALRNPLKPSWGEPYTEIAPRMIAALHRARATAAGHEAVCVSHQLPVETLRRAMTRRKLPHLPLPHSRLCNLASVTSFTFDGDRLVRWGYSRALGAVVKMAGGSAGGGS